MKRNPDIDRIRERLVTSQAFDDLKLVLEDKAVLKIMEIQGSNKKPYEEMCVDKAILNLFMNLCSLLENEHKIKTEMNEKNKKVV